MSKSINKYPLSGFSKISYEEFMGIFHILKIYSGLDKEQKQMIDLVLDGMKYREAAKNSVSNKDE